MEIVLPTKRSEASKNLEDYSILMYGEEKIGKTSLCSMFQDAVFLMCEPGGKALNLYKVDIFSWEDFISCTRLLKQDKKFKNIVVDTVDVLYPMMQRFVGKREGFDDPADVGYGKGFRQLDLEFSKWMTYLLKLGKGVIFTSHATEKEYETREGKTVDKTVPTMPGGARKILEPMVDIWACYRYAKDGKREIVVQGSDRISAGSRAKGHFVGVPRIPAGDSEEEAYKNFVDAFNNKLPKLENVNMKMKLKNK